MANNVQAVQFREHIIRPVLAHLHPVIPFSMGAVELLLGTAIQESGLMYIAQIGGGPARGFWQMEPATHLDIWRWLRARDGLTSRIDELLAQAPQLPLDALSGNAFYACALARVHYFRAPEKLPEAGDLQGQAKLWKLRYNTPLGAGRVEDYVTNWRRAMR